MKVEQMTLGSFGTNCYILIDETTMDAYCVDPGDYAEVIQNKLQENGWNLKGILLTHGHFDHIYAVKALKRVYDIPVYALEAEKELLNDSIKNLSDQFAAPYTLDADVYLHDGETLLVAGSNMQVLATPGHTAGSCCFYFPQEDLLFSGDTLFCASVGRTDMPTGSFSRIIQSIKEKLFVLDDRIKVYPGHGEATTIGYEKDYNPFLS